MIPKAGKVHIIPSSYGAISLLSRLSKLLEKCFLTRVTPNLRAHNVVPAHKFGFWERHGIVEIAKYFAVKEAKNFTELRMGHA